MTECRLVESTRNIIGDSIQALRIEKRQGNNIDFSAVLDLTFAMRTRSTSEANVKSAALARVADAAGNWVDTLAPLWSRPYLRLARLDRPIGSWLLLLPCWWSAALAAPFAHNSSRLAVVIPLFFLGAFAMRGAGCTWTAITDRDLDAKVERTRS